MMVPSQVAIRAVILRIFQACSAVQSEREREREAAGVGGRGASKPKTTTYPDASRENNDAVGD